jgi:hypothetical protein
MPRPPLEDRSRLRLSGVVIRISGGCRSMRRRSSGGVSPERVSGTCHRNVSSERVIGRMTGRESRRLRSIEPVARAV